MSGSGKSTWISKNRKVDEVSVSADNFFYNQEGMYKFNAKELPEAHKACLRCFMDSARLNFPGIFVDNTNLSKDEIFPYLKIAQAYGYEVTFVLFWPKYNAETTIQFCADRNTHNVPTKTLEKQYNKFHDSYFQQFISEQLGKDVQYISIEFG
jgi:predicted kinase